MALTAPIIGYEELYLVTDEGDVISLPKVITNYRGSYLSKEKTLKQGTRAGKYKFVVLTKDGEEKKFAVHRLVAIAFCENPNNYTEVNHKDENPSNNRADNLEWCSHQYNIEYSKNRPVEQFTDDGEKIAEYKSISYASSMTGIIRTAINNVVCGKAHTAGGYVWKYKEGN